MITFSWHQGCYLTKLVTYHNILHYGCPEKLTHTRMAIMAILLKLAIVAWHYMALNMVNMGVSAKNWQIVDCL